MIVYHSSYLVVDRPDIHHSREALDFGKGFYVTAIRDQALRYADRFLLRKMKAYLNIYDLDDSWRNENVKIFKAYDGEWLDFIAANRSMKAVNAFDPSREAWQTIRYLELWSFIWLVTSQKTWHYHG